MTLNETIIFSSSTHYHIHHKMDEGKLTIIREDMPEGVGSHMISGHRTFLFIHKYWFRKVNKLVRFDIQYIVGDFNK